MFSKKFLSMLMIVLFIISFYGVSLADNERSPVTDKFHAYIKVDTDPTGDGWWSNEFTIKNKLNGGAAAIFLNLSTTGTATGTITVQFMPYYFSVDTWVDYVGSDTPFVTTDGNRKAIMGGETGVRWRIGVKPGDFSGTGNIIGGLGY